MNDKTLLCLAGGGLLIWWISSGSGQTGKVEKRLDVMEQVYTEFDKADKKKDSRIAYHMNAILVNTDEFRNMTGQEFAKMTKQKLVDFVQVTLCGKDRTLDQLRRLRNILGKLANDNKQGLDNSLTITIRLYEIAMTFLQSAIEASERTIQIISDIYQHLPDESSVSSEVLLYFARSKIKMIKEL